MPDLYAHIDSHGRITIPQELLDLVGIDESTDIVIGFEGRYLTLRPAEHACFLCGGEPAINNAGILLCRKCADLCKDILC